MVKNTTNAYSQTLSQQNTNSKMLLPEHDEKRPTKMVKNTTKRKAATQAMHQQNTNSKIITFMLLQEQGEKRPTKSGKDKESEIQERKCLPEEFSTPLGPKSGKDKESEKQERKLNNHPFSTPLGPSKAKDKESEKQERKLHHPFSTPLGPSKAIGHNLLKQANADQDLEYLVNTSIVTHSSAQSVDIYTTYPKKKKKKKETIIISHMRGVLVIPYQIPVSHLIHAVVNVSYYRSFIAIVVGNISPC